MGQIFWDLLNDIKVCELTANVVQIFGRLGSSIEFLIKNLESGDCVYRVPQLEAKAGRRQALHNN